MSAGDSSSKHWFDPFKEINEIFYFTLGIMNIQKLYKTKFSQLF